MRRNIVNLLTFLVFSLSFGLTSCNDYLDVLPKGQKIPTSLADYEAFIRDEYGCQRVDITQTSILLNDRFLSSSTLSYYPLYKANYFWDESANRIALNNADEGAYYNGYGAISTFNLIIEHAPSATEATDAQKNELVAQAKVLRAMTYYNLVNYYADTYDEATAATKLSVPLITSANVGASYKQVSIKEMYDFMLNDVKEALPYLPKKAATILHPNLGTAYALNARIYLQMGNYAIALENAENALKENSSLYDWVAYYNSNKAQIENPTSYTTTTSPMNFSYVENYNYRHGASYSSSTESSLQVDRATRFEAGDSRFASRWKLRTVGADTYYTSTTRGFFNYGGITTTEVYLIKAECLARSGKYDLAMDALDAVRQKRILPAQYVKLTATTEEEAISYIRRTKGNELILTITAFADARRYNKEAKYARNLTKVFSGQSYSLSPNSHMWTMPFPMGAISNPGNGSIKQNVEK